MANNIQNRIKVIGDINGVQKLLSHIKGIDSDGEEMQIDFNKIKPMPEEMDIDVHSGIKMWVEICTGQIDFSCLFSLMENSATETDCKALLTKMDAAKAMAYLTGERDGNVKDFSEEEFSIFIQCLKNYREFGSISWYEWSIKNWGTGCNAYEQNDKRNTENTIFFQTVWSSPIELIGELSKMFPLVKIELTYADENCGSNTGIIIFKNGKEIEINQPKDQSKEGYDIYFELNPDMIDNYKLVEGEYVYID